LIDAILHLRAGRGIRSGDRAGNAELDLRGRGSGQSERKAEPKTELKTKPKTKFDNPLHRELPVG
jgi:hypothetical protein